MRKQKRVHTVMWAKEDGLDAAAEDAGYTVSTGTFTQEDDSVDDNL